MGFYDERVLPWLMNFGMDTEPVRRERRAALAGVRGVVLEIGFGTGHNLPFYPEGVQRVVAVDPSRRSAELARKRIAAAPFPVEYVPLEGERIDAPDQSVDAVVSTYSLCTIPDPAAALAHVARVLKPGGAFHLLEHGLADDPKVQRWQHRLNRFNHAVCGGCNLNRDIEGIVRAAGFTFDEIDKHYAEGGPKVVTWLTRGIARVAPST